MTGQWQNDYKKDAKDAKVRSPLMRTENIFFYFQVVLVGLKKDLMEDANEVFSFDRSSLCDDALLYFKQEVGSLGHLVKN